MNYKIINTTLKTIWNNKSSYASMEGINKKITTSVYEVVITILLKIIQSKRQIICPLRRGLNTFGHRFSYCIHELFVLRFFP